MSKEPMSREAILRLNIAALEVALRRQTDRANEARQIAMQTWIAERDLWMERAKEAEAELAKLAKQEPVTYVFDPNGYAINGKHNEIADALPTGIDLYAAPVHAPAVPEEWREVMAKLVDDVQAACDAEHPHREQYPFIMRRYNNDMEIVEKARALLQSATGDKL